MRALAICVTLLASSTVFADRISGSPPTDCPAGSYPDVDHGGPHCAIARCTSDSDCTRWDGELRCGDVASICVVTDEFNTYTRRPNQRERAASACTNGTCSEGTCETQRFCVRSGDQVQGQEQVQVQEQEPVQEQVQEQEQEQEQEQAQAQAQVPVQAQDAPVQDEEESGCSAAGVSAGPAWLLLFFLRRRR